MVLRIESVGVPDLSFKGRGIPLAVFWILWSCDHVSLGQVRLCEITFPLHLLVTSFKDGRRQGSGQRPGGQVQAQANAQPGSAPFHSYFRSLISSRREATPTFPHTFQSIHNALTSTSPVQIRVAGESPSWVILMDLKLS